MIEALYDKLALPDACHLGKRVFKKLFHEHAVLGVTDKKAFAEDIDTITWQYTLKPSTIPIQPFDDDQREYHEIAVIQVDLKTQRRTSRIAEVIHRAIPYPLLVVFVLGEACAISLAHKRFSQAEKGAIVAEEFVLTDWLNLSDPTPTQRAFLDSLSLRGLPNTHFFALYSALVDRAIALDCARLTGEFRLEAAAEKREARRGLLKACHELEVRIADCKTAIKNETQFASQVELNMKTKQLEQQLQRAKGQL